MRFSKMHGLGNDFMIVDAITQCVHFSKNLICKLSDRHFGVGFDQLLLVEPPYHPNLDFHYRVFNSDGGEVEQCGNGARCLGKFVLLKGLTKKKKLRVSIKKEWIEITVLRNDLVRVNMGEPKFEFKNNLFPSKNSNIYELFAAEQLVQFNIVSIGNPHCVIQVSDVETAPVKALGSVLESHDFFPGGINVGFMQILNSGHIRLRVYERSVGETKACGSAACAAVACGIQQNVLKSKVRVDLFGGTLRIFWKGFGNPLFMTGSATYVYDGLIDL